MGACHPGPFQEEGQDINSKYNKIQCNVINSTVQKEPWAIGRRESHFYNGFVDGWMDG